MRIKSFIRTRSDVITKVGRLLKTGSSNHRSDQTCAAADIGQTAGTFIRKAQDPARQRPLSGVSGTESQEVRNQVSVDDYQEKRNPRQHRSKVKVRRYSLGDLGDWQARESGKR